MNSTGKLKLVITLSLSKGEITDEKEIFVLTMSTLFATQLINSNHANASTESVDKNFVVPESGINKIIPAYDEFKSAPK